jgi:hypothetical protein
LYPHWRWCWASSGANSMPGVSRLASGQSHPAMNTWATSGFEHDLNVKRDLSSYLKKLMLVNNRWLELFLEDLQGNPFQ